MTWKYYINIMDIMIKYICPDNWIKYDPIAISQSLVDAKVAILSLQTIPYQRDWVESLQELELKREVAGTSRIEGADFTETELDAAMKETADELLTRSQRQAHTALKAYKWIIRIPDDNPIDEKLIKAIHRIIVTGADDDHCPPGKIRQQDENVNFGSPRHRGAPGGLECEQGLARFTKALQREYREHDPIIQALATHYHFAAMHPFLDGNGRTARVLEALLLQRAGLRDTCFIAMSNYYYDEKTAYLKVLSECRSNNHDLTSFLNFALKGVEIQIKRLLSVVRKEISKELYRGIAYNLFKRLISKKKRVLAKRQLNILHLLLKHDDGIFLKDVIAQTENFYNSLGSPRKALIRDLNDLIGLRAIKNIITPKNGSLLIVDLDWPTKITETEFFEGTKKLPKGKGYSFLR